MDPFHIQVPQSSIHPHTSTFKKQKQPILYEVIYIDTDDDDDDDYDLVVLGETSRERNKAKAIEAIHVGDHQVLPDRKKVGTVSGIKSSNYQSSESNNFINVDDLDSDQSSADDDNIYMFSDDYDYMDVDEYALVQAQFDNMDLPYSIEVPFTLFPEYDIGSKNTGKSTLQPSKSKISGFKMGTFSLPTKMDNVGQSSGTKLSSKAAPSKKKSSVSQRSGRYLTNSLGVGSSKSRQYMKSVRSEMKKSAFSGSGVMKLGHGGKKKVGSSSSYSSKYMHGETSGAKSARDGPNGVENKTLRKFRSFKTFDTVSDVSDHNFLNHKSFTNPKSWAKIIEKQWKILEKHLPDTIFVRVYESRMDIMRAVIIGAEGTPYHDGLFFFDLFFPSNYPNVPPEVHYHSRGLHINPNLYVCGKVCLRLLNTWTGYMDENWIPSSSTILQVLVSIQGLILNAKPCFNEPGYARSSGTELGEKMSLQYNENTLIRSLKTMMYMIRRPPKNFEDFVVGHFYSRAHDILAACKSYMEGAQVGCLVKGRIQDVHVGEGSCSQKFKDEIVGFANLLVIEFRKLGVKGCKKFKSTKGSDWTDVNESKRDFDWTDENELNGDFDWSDENE